MENKKINRVLFIRASSEVITSTNHPHHCSVPYTLKYMQSLLKRKDGFETKLIDCMAGPRSNEDLYNCSVDWSPQVVVLMISVSSFKNILNYAEALKKQLQCLVIGVGQAVLPDIGIDEQIEPVFDFLLPGEAEEEFVSLLEKLQSGEDRSSLKEIYRRQREEGKVYLVNNLDQLPFPAYSQEEIKSYHFIYPLRLLKRVSWGHVLSSRGCYNRCNFCSQITRESYGNKVRLRSALSVVDEIEILIKAGVNVISFDDDDFSGSQKHVQAICKEIKSRNLKIQWIAHARIDRINPDLLCLMKESGCILLRFGIESGSERIIKNLNKFQKDLDWSKRFREAFHDLKKTGIASIALFIIGSPTESEDEFNQTVRLALEIDPDLIQIHYFTPYPDSAYSKQRSIQQGSSNTDKMYHYEIPLVNLSSMPDDTFKKARGLFYRKFIFQPKFIFKHLFKYAIFYILNPRTFTALLGVRKI